MLLFIQLMRVGIIPVILIMLLSGCKDANRGQSAAYESPVADGQIILVKRNQEIGAFILKNQRSSPEVTDYTWFYRSDGQGRFTPGDPAVQTGTVTNATQVAFASFSVDWSINTEGKGWVYFSALPLQFNSSGDYVMCVTTETNLASINAKDWRWKYRSRSKVNVKELIKSRFK